MKHERAWSEEDDVSDVSDASAASAASGASNASDASDVNASAQSTRGTETPAESICRKRRRLLWDEPTGGTQDPATAESKILLELTRELMRTNTELQEQLHRNNCLEQKVENLEKNLTEQHKNVLAQQGQLEQLALVKSEEKLKVEEEEASLTQSKEKLAEAQIISENLEHCLLKELELEKEITVHVAQYQDEMSTKDAYDAYAALLEKKIHELQQALSARDKHVQQLNREKKASTEEQCMLKYIVEEHEHYAAQLKRTIGTLEEKVSVKNHLIQQLQENPALEESVIDIEMLYVNESVNVFQDETSRR